MGKYDALRKRINAMSKALNGSMSPFLAYLNKDERGYSLVVCFWDGLAYNTQRNRVKDSLCKSFSTFEDAENFLLDYLKENKPLEPFVLFTNEESIM